MNDISAINQFAFVKGRFILESIVTAHEIIHSLKHSDAQGISLKLDYEKSFDMVDLHFLMNSLRIRGFSSKVIDIVKFLTRGCSVGVRLNSSIGSYFNTSRGLRQGYPFSPLLFNSAVDVLTRMLIKASAADLIKGLGCDLRLGGVICLQYADDTILFFDSDPIYATNLKWVLTCFEQVSSMRINYNKSELIPLGLSNGETLTISTIFGCVVGAFPIKYLGTPLHYDKLRRMDIQPLSIKL